MTILEYFGEKGQSCGKCDICIGVSETILTVDQIKKVFEHLCTIVSQQPINIKKYVSFYPFNKRKRIVRALKDFEREGKITMDNSGDINLAGS